ncbi:MAG: pirin family protein [Pseudomonadota bacterium]
MNTSNKNIKVRKSADRGHANHGWLDSYHSFSFANYYDPAYMGYSVLRVINEDIVAPAQGFGMHGHRDMEIVTYMLQGALRHQDSMGNGSVIHAGEVQRMSAGTGVKHSEFNASNDEPAHLLQIWLLPEKEGITPSYEEKSFDAASKTNQWRLLASRDAREGSLLVHQDLALFATILEAGHQLDYSPAVGRSVYVHVASGDVTLNGITLTQGDAVAVDNEATIVVMSQTEAEILLFDLPPAKNYSNQ